MKNYKIIFTVLTTTLMSAQAPVIEWQKRLGSTSADVGQCLIHTADGGFLAAGTSQSEALYEKTGYCRGEEDYWIVKMDGNSTIEWDKTMGGGPAFGATMVDKLTDVKQTPDGGYIVTGLSNSMISGEKSEQCRGQFDYWILKLSALGVIEWQRTLGGDSYDNCYSVVYTLDGGYLLSGYSLSGISGDKSENLNGESDLWFIKLSATGNIVWQNTIGGNSGELIYFNSIVELDNGNFVLAASSFSNASGDKSENSRGSSDIWLLEIDSLGNILHQKTIGGSDSDYPRAVIKTNDGNFMIACESQSPISGEKTESCRGFGDYWMLKVDPAFNIIWQHTYGGSITDTPTGILQYADGSYLITGYSYSDISGDKTTALLGYSDAWLVKLDEVGNMQWQKGVGGIDAAGSQEYLTNPIALENGRVMLFGKTPSDISGDIVDFCRGNSDYWMVKLAPEALATTAFDVTNISVFPNPTTRSVHVNLPKTYTTAKVSITTITGQVIYNKTFDNTSNFNLDISGEAGLYFVSIADGKNVKQTFKIIKQ